MEQFFPEGLAYWHWWVLAMVLAGLEIFAPGAVLIFMGIAAGLVGVVLLVVPGIAWEIQAGIFAVLSLVLIFAWRTYDRSRPKVEPDNTLNQRGRQYIGRVFTLEEAIVNGVGKLKVDDTIWKARGPDLPKKTRVKVTGLDGTSLTVEAAEG